jgi:hypothetical protein
MAYLMPAPPQEILDDMAAWPTLEEIQQRFEQEQAAFEALPPEEQARILRQRAEEQEAARLARTCEHCGCDPEEHGGY